MPSNLEKIVSHIRHVQENASKLAFALMDLDLEKWEHIAIRLISNAMVHDQSKFHGIEYKYLGNFEPEKPPEFKLAHEQHVTTNLHHPEAWNSIHNMPLVYICELVCDWKARSAELGTNIWDYVEGPAMQRFGFTKEDKVYEEIKFALDLIVEKWS